MNALVRGTLFVTAVLGVVLIPLAVLGLAFEDRVEGWLETDLTAVERFWLLAGLLATDIVLPIPSSAVSTYGGGILGTGPATLASFLGMTAGAVLGFAAARALGSRLAGWMVGDADRAGVEAMVARRGPLALVLMRPLPILAEASVLVMGAMRLPWTAFLVPVVLSNLAVSLVYAACGEFFRGHNALPWAVVATGTIPLVASLLARRWLPGFAPSQDEAENRPAE